MSLYRLELWFDFNHAPSAGNGTYMLNWGMAKANAADNYPPRLAVTWPNGGVPVAAADGVVTIEDGNSSQLDIYVIDVTNDGVQRYLNSITVDYEAKDGVSNKNPVPGAIPLRQGMTGAAFQGDNPAPPSGNSPGSTGQETEITVYSVIPAIRGQRRWSLASGYWQLTDGDYTFSGSLTVSDGIVSKQFSFDPEMDVKN